MTRRGRGLTVADLRDGARRRLPRMVFDFVDGGAEDESTLRENRRGFADVAFRPRVLVDVRVRPQAVRVLGQDLAMPVILGPTGLARMVGRDGEKAAAVAAERFGTVSVVSSGSSVSLEDVAASVAVPQWFQLYPWGDRATIESLIGRARACGYRVMVVTVDVPVVGAREKDLRNGLTVPPRINPRTGWDVLSHPGGWLSCCAARKSRSRTSPAWCPAAAASAAWPLRPRDCSIPDTPGPISPGWPSSGAARCSSKVS